MTNIPETERQHGKYYCNTIKHKGNNEIQLTVEVYLLLLILLLDGRLFAK